MQGTVAVSLLDGTKQEATGPVFGMSDRIAFERQFQIPALKLAELEDLFDKKGKLRPGADLSQVREEWFAFLGYRVLRRAGVVTQSFDEWVEVVDDVQLNIEQAPNPTEEAPQPGASQS